MTSEVSDDALARLAAMGQVGAFDQLYERYLPRVYSRLTHVLGAVPDREDVTQQIFFRLHQALPSFRNEASFSTFLYSISSKTTIDHLRRRKRRPSHLDEGALSELAASLPDPIDRVHARDRIAALSLAMARLKPKPRMAFALVVIERLSEEEAARQMELSPRSIQRLVRQATKKLRAWIGPDEPPALHSSPRRRS